MKKTLVRTPKPRFGFKPLPLRARLGASMILLALVAGIGFAGSRPAHTAGGPIAVSVANTPLRVTDSEAARTPFSIRVYPNDIGFNTFVVPAGKRLVIQQVSGFTTSSTAPDIQIESTVSGRLDTLRVPFAVSVHGYSYASQSLTDYADPGSSVYVVVDDTVYPDYAGFTVDIVGYTIDAS